jgi:hypothetical protein
MQPRKNVERQAHADTRACMQNASCTREDSDCIPANIRRLDPVASYKEFHNFAGDNTELISIHAHRVRSDGTVDLEDA